MFDGLQAVLDTYEIDIPLLPNWIPEGYEEADVRTFDTPKQRQFTAKYQNAENTIKIWIENHLGSDPLQIEQSDTAVEVYLHNGIEYFIFEDNEQHRAAWLRDSFICYISGPLSVEELKMMIDSIEEGQ